MSKGKYPSISLVTPEFKLFGANLVTARAANFPGAKAKYSISMPLSETEGRPLLDAIASVAKQAWPSISSKGQIALPNGDLKSIYRPVSDGSVINQGRVANGKTPFDFLAGKLVFRASTVDDRRRPALWNIDGTPANPEDFTGGAICRAEVNFVALTNNPTNPGVAAYLNQVLLVRKVASGGGNVDAFRSFLSASAPINPFAAVVTDEEIPY